MNRMDRNPVCSTVARAAGLLLAAIAWAAFAAFGNAQGYPAKPVRLIVPFPAGGGSDIVGRIVATRLTEQLKQQVIVDNRGGAGGSIGTEAAVRAAPDGCTAVRAATAASAVHPALYPSATPADGR